MEREFMKLYELSTQYQHIVDMLNGADSDTSEMLKDTLDAINDAIEVKADVIAKIMQDIDSERMAVEAEMKRLSDRAEKLKKQHKNLKEYLFESMDVTGKIKFKTALFNFSIQNNPPAVSILDESLIADEFKISETIVKLDKRAIMERLKNKEIITGAELTQGRKLVIK
jgi:predicted RNA-binding protein with RPS1 domain